MSVETNLQTSRPGVGNFLSSPAWLLLLLATGVVAAGGGGAGMPWDAPMAAFVASITGPWAGAIALIAIVISGAMLIFGGELNQFARTMVFIILVMAVIVGAAAFLTSLGIVGATLPALVTPL
ncbi:MAG: TrbC/VirB2 family protein [Burkholderiaceae bacterium]